MKKTKIVMYLSLILLMASICLVFFAFLKMNNHILDLECKVNTYEEILKQVETGYLINEELEDAEIALQKLNDERLDYLEAELREGIETAVMLKEEMRIRADQANEAPSTINREEE